MAVAGEPRALVWRLFKPTVTVVAFVALLVGLRRVITGFDYDDVVAGFAAVPARAIALMIAALVAQYALYVVREYAAVSYAVQTGLGLPRIAVAALIARSLSTLGIATITGFALRLRLYEAFGLHRRDIGTITVYNESTYYVGLIATCAVVLSVAGLPPMVGAAIALPPTRIVGLLAIAVLAGYLGWSLRRQQPLRIRAFELPVIPGRLVAAQVGLPVIDAFLGGAIVWLCLPASAGLSYFDTTTICVVSSIAGSLSQVPGGLGVFEASVLGFVPPPAHAATLAALLVRRAVVNLLPIASGAILLVGVELRQRRRHQVPVVVASLVPIAVAVWTFAAGVLLMLTAAMPVPYGPGAVAGPIGQAVTLGVGVATLVVSRGLYRHSPGAWLAALTLDACRAALAAAAGPHWPTFLVTMASIALLLGSRKSFDGKPTYPDRPVDEAIRWWTAVMVAVIGIGWIAVVHPDTTSRLARARAAGLIAAGALAISAVVIQARVARRRAARAAARAARDAARALDAAERGAAP